MFPSTQHTINMAEVAQSHIQETVHPLLRHPRPLKRDPAKAQRMLGLIADSEAKALQRERSKTTKWLERPMYEHLEASDLDVAKEKEHIEQAKVDDYAIETDNIDSDLLDRWTKPDRQESPRSLDLTLVQVESGPSTDASTLRKQPPRDPQARRPSTWIALTSINSQPQQPESFQSDDSSFEADSFSLGNSRPMMRHMHAQAWDTSSQTGANGRPMSLQAHHPSSGRDSLSPFGNPQHTERRPRPKSLATFNARDRPNSKIASSRGLRNNSYPNFSKPIPEITPRPVPGERIENYTTGDRMMDDEAGSSTFSSPLRATMDVSEARQENTKANKKSKKRWSSIPITFKNITRRRFSVSTEDPKPVVDMDNLPETKATENVYNPNRHYQGTDGTVQNLHLQGLDRLPTPNHSPLKMASPTFESPLPPPFAPWADVPPTPPSCLHKRTSSGLSTSTTVDSVRQQSPIATSVRSRPTSLLSRGSTSGISPSITGNVASPRPSTSRRGTPSLEQTCIICKISKRPSEFLNRRITANCWHEPATCLQCLELWIENCIVTKGWERCSCPECGELMASEDVGAFTADSSFSAFYSEKMY